MAFTGRIAACLLATCAAALGAETTGPCDKDLSEKSNPNHKSAFCIAFELDASGRVTIRSEQSRFYGNATYQTMSAAGRKALVSQWNAFIRERLLQQSPMWELALTADERSQLAAAQLPKPTHDQIDKLLKGPKDWAHALPAYNGFARCPTCPQGRKGAQEILDEVYNQVLNVNLFNATPLSGKNLDRIAGIAYLFADDLIQDPRKQVHVVIKPAGEGLQPPPNPITCDWVYAWLDQEQKGKAWAAGEIRQKLGNTLAEIGLQSEVTVSYAGQSPRVTVDIALVHLIRVPSDLHPGKPESAVTILKILSVLLPAEDYSAVVKDNLSALVNSTNLFVDLDLSKLRGHKGLYYLDLFQFPVEQAGLQEIGYVVSAEKEAATQSSFATTLILHVAKVDNKEADRSKDAKAAAPDPKKNMSPAQKPPVTTASRAQTLPPLTGKPVSPRSDENPMPQIPAPQWNFGVGLQYRSGQAVRPLGTVSTKDVSTPWGVMSFQGTAGAENTNPVGSLNWENNYIAFGKLHHQLSFSLSGKTDSLANRLLGSAAQTDVRTTGGQGRLEYNAVNDWRGVYVRLFGQGARESLAFSRSGADIPNEALWTADAGATIDLLHEARPLPGRFELVPQVHFGTQSASPAKPYTVWMLDASAHQRISDVKLISADISGHFRDATSATPIFDLPSLGGGDSLRGFRPDDVLARRYWSLQTELWMPLPGTLSALPGGKGLATVRWFLRENIRIAWFVDVGGAYQIPSTVEPAALLEGATQAVVHPGVRWAPGLGIRVVRGNFALKLDWAYGQGYGQSGTGHGRTDMGVVQNGAF